jgi:hypothetical protein
MHESSRIIAVRGAQEITPEKLGLELFLDATVLYRAEHLQRSAWQIKVSPGDARESKSPTICQPPILARVAPPGDGRPLIGQARFGRRQPEQTKQRRPKAVRTSTSSARPSPQGRWGTPLELGFQQCPVTVFVVRAAPRRRLPIDQYLRRPHHVRR